MLEQTNTRKWWPLALYLCKRILGNDQQSKKMQEDQHRSIEAQEQKPSLRKFGWAVKNRIYCEISKQIIWYEGPLHGFSLLFLNEKTNSSLLISCYVVSSKSGIGSMNSYYGELVQKQWSELVSQINQVKENPSTKHFRY